MLGRFVTALKELLNGEELPRDSNSASITVIPKEWQDPLFCQNYQPIPLLNIDLKLFTKVLASVLLPFIQKLISPEQVGFLIMREARDNTLVHPPFNPLCQIPQYPYDVDIC